MTTANKLTLCRVVMIPIFIVLLYQDFTHHLLAALGVFILASITDFVDGYVARHYNQVTDFGKFMDPLADKLLVMSAMAWFVQAGWMAAWAFFLVIARELAVTGLRLVAVEQGRVIAAAKSGKVKTASTMVCICLCSCCPTPPPCAWCASGSSCSRPSTPASSISSKTAMCWPTGRCNALSSFYTQRPLAVASGRLFML